MFGAYSCLTEFRCLACIKYIPFDSTEIFPSFSACNYGVRFIDSDNNTGAM